MKIALYNTNGTDLYLHQTSLGMLLCKTEDLESIPMEKLSLAVEHGQRVNLRCGNRILMDNGHIHHSMTSLSESGIPDTNGMVKEMVVLCDQQGFNPTQKWLVNSVEIKVTKVGVGPEFFGYPQDGMKPAHFQVIYRDGSTRNFRQTVKSLPEDVSVTTEELSQDRKSYKQVS